MTWIFRHELDKVKGALHESEMRQQDLGLQLQNAKIAGDSLRGEAAHLQARYVCVCVCNCLL
jgi:hypothetical protein